MSFAEGQLFTIGATPYTLARVGSGLGTGAFSSPDSLVGFTVSHANGKRLRSTARLTLSKISSDPMFPTQNIRPSMSFYVVADRPVNGFTIVEQKQVADAFVAWATASTGAKIGQLLAGEN